jgi:hypothetical protein
MRKIVIRDLESSKLMKAIDNKSAKPVTKRVMHPTTIKTSGNFHVGVCPLMKSTAVRGISPMKKLIALEIVDERANISGLT